MNGLPPDSPRTRPSLSAELAIANNHAWYMTIFRARGLASRIDEHYWSTDEKPPPYHSHLVTRTRGEAAIEAQLRRLAQLAEGSARGALGCKDSHDQLPRAELLQLGLRELFGACWYGCAPGGSAPTPDPALQVQRVVSSAGLLAWEEQWRETSPAGPARCFPDRLLADPDLELYSLSLDGAAAGGFALNRSLGAIGLSNVFHGEAVEPGIFVRDCALAARRLHPELPIVGYGPQSEVKSRAGWVRPARSASRLGYLNGA